MGKLDLINALDEIDLVLAIEISAFDVEINEQHLRLSKDSIILSQRKLSAILQQLEFLSQRGKLVNTCLWPMLARRDQAPRTLEQALLFLPSR